MKIDDEHSDVYINILISTALILVNILMLLSIIMDYKIMKLNTLIEVVIAVANILFMFDVTTSMNIMRGSQFNTFTATLIIKTALVGILYTIYDFKTTGNKNIVNISCIVTSSLIFGIITIGYICITLTNIWEKRKAQKNVK